VLLADDFPSHYDGGDWVGLPEMEQNLLYVAVTRAMRVLEINDSVDEALQEYAGRGNIVFHDDDDLDAEYGFIAANYDRLAAMDVIQGEQAVEAMHREEDRVTYYADGSGFRHGSGPAGPLYFDKFGNT
jgi:hypothetical protein